MQRHKSKAKGHGNLIVPHKPNKQKFDKQKIRSEDTQNAKRAITDLEIKKLRESYEEIDVTNITKFSQLPLSQKTQRALREFKFVHPTEVQRQSIGPALQGKDVLGAAITGSGKTLAFLIPVLEHLYVNKWSRTDGVGAIIISPTRELAYQIFETLKKVGKNHDFSAGLIIGGKNLKFERSRMDQCNILICTPGRLLQHMDENPLFSTTTMEMLVLDEADRCLDMGFQKALNSIIENFPSERQTLLFSATQTNTVQDLARLNLHSPVYIGYGTNTEVKSADAGNAILAVPELLQQSYVVVPLQDKITVLWSFIKNHLKQKIIVFVSSCKQAKYLFEIFCKLRPGVGLLALYGTLHQDRRIAIYEDFLRKSHVVMFATDVASRGLDFPAVNWVVQLDCPEDVTQYIHRAGRSARNKTRGECLLVLTPNEEESMIDALQQQLKVDIKSVQIDPKKLFSPRAKMEAFLAQFPELRASAQRAFVAYIKSVFLMRNKRVFNAFSLDLDAYAQSLGLAVTPRVQFLERALWRHKQQTSKAENQEEATTATAVEPDSLSANESLKLCHNALGNEDDEEDDDFIKVKRRDHDVEGYIPDDTVEVALDDVAEHGETVLEVPKREKLVTKAAQAKKALKKNLQINSKVKFDEHGNTVADERNQMKVLATAQKRSSNKDDDGGIDIVLSKALLTEEDAYDKQRFREFVKKRHKLQREKSKKQAEREKRAAEASDDDNGDSDESAADLESEHSVDLSWLPDPNKIYAKQTDKDTDSSASANDEPTNDSTHDEEPQFKKSKLADHINLDDAEAIAANLLGN